MGTVIDVNDSFMNRKTLPATRAFPKAPKVKDCLACDDLPEGGYFEMVGEPCCCGGTRRRREPAA